MPTIRDVAKLAGVAPITVSRVVNDSGYVSKETRARVEAAVDELGYVPNMLGPSLRFKQTMTLAVVVTDIANPFWTTVTRGVEDVAQANGIAGLHANTVMFGWSRRKERLESQLRIMRAMSHARKNTIITMTTRPKIITTPGNFVTIT